MSSGGSSKVIELVAKLYDMGISVDPATVAGNYGYYQKLARVSKQQNKATAAFETDRKRLEKTIARKNAKLSKLGASNQRFNIDASIIPENKLKEVLNFTVKLPEVKLRGAKLQDYKASVNELLKNTLNFGRYFKEPAGKKVSVGRATGKFGDKRLAEMGKIGWQDQMYFENFLLAAARIGNYWLYNYAFTNGFDVVKKLLDAGFEIKEIYLRKDDLTHKLSMREVYDFQSDEVVKRYTSRLTITTKRIRKNARIWRDPSIFEDQNQQVVDILQLG